MPFIAAKRAAKNASAARTAAVVPAIAVAAENKRMKGGDPKGSPFRCGSCQMEQKVAIRTTIWYNEENQRRNIAMLKRILALILCLLMSVSVLAACGEPEATEPTPAPTAPQPPEEAGVLKVLTLGHSLAVDSGHMLALIANAEGYDKMIVADNEDPKAITYYRQNGFKIRACRNKFAGSRLSNTRKVKRFRKIVVSPKCKNVIRELKDLTYKKDAKGNVIYDQFNIDPHSFSAIWYALDGVTVADVKDKDFNSKAG
jgi:phage terminase large subunit